MRTAGGAGEELSEEVKAQERAQWQWRLGCMGRPLPGATLEDSAEDLKGIASYEGRCLVSSLLIVFTFHVCDGHTCAILSRLHQPKCFLGASRLQLRGWSCMALCRWYCTYACCWLGMFTACQQAMTATCQTHQDLHPQGLRAALVFGNKRAEL